MKTNYKHYKEFLLNNEYGRCKIYLNIMGKGGCSGKDCNQECFVETFEWLNKPYQPPKQKLTLEEKVILSVLPKGLEWRGYEKKFENY